LSKKVRAAQEARAAVARAEFEAAQKAAEMGLPFERRHPGEVLLDSVAASDVLMQHLLRQRAAGVLTVEESVALGFAIDRAARTAKVALDAGVQERMAQVQEGVARAQAQKLIAAMDRLLADDRVLVVGDPRQVVVDALRGLDADGQPAEQLAIAR
jgi:hypothetical protein